MATSCDSKKDDTYASTHIMQTDNNSIYSYLYHYKLVTDFKYNIIWQFTTVAIYSLIHAL